MSTLLARQGKEGYPLYRAYCAVCECYVPRGHTLAEHLETRLHTTNSRLRASDPLFHLTDVVDASAADAAATVLPLNDYDGDGNDRVVRCSMVDASTCTVEVSRSSCSSSHHGAGAGGDDADDDPALRLHPAEAVRREDGATKQTTVQSRSNNNILTAPQHQVDHSSALTEVRRRINLAATSEEKEEGQHCCDQCVGHRVRKARMRRLLDEYKRNKDRLMAGRLFLKWHRRWFFAATRRTKSIRAVDILDELSIGGGKKMIMRERGDGSGHHKEYTTDDDNGSGAAGRQQDLHDDDCADAPPSVSALYHYPPTTLHDEGGSVQPANIRSSGAMYDHHNDVPLPQQQQQEVVVADRRLRRVLRQLSECSQRHIAAALSELQTSSSRRNNRMMRDGPSAAAVGASSTPLSSVVGPTTSGRSTTRHRQQQSWTDAPCCPCGAYHQHHHHDRWRGNNNSMETDHFDPHGYYTSQQQFGRATNRQRGDYCFASVNQPSTGGRGLHRPSSARYYYNGGRTAGNDDDDDEEELTSPTVGKKGAVEETRIRKYFKQLLWYDLPMARECGEWQRYRRLLRRGVSRLEASGGRAAAAD